ncbi:MAG TPA: DUF134 domain-containing protein [Candidatus Omnitrophota bacterium]|nr:DUF134 domain-containing protein [Candidatus Omnitrophota bacterium]HRZ14818.1 DUF134 domain-containing protein [Candidatus Omnitrophota bacterium]
MDDRQFAHKKIMARRGRPIKKRMVVGSPRISLFSPRGRPGRPDYVLLGVDQLEALRLADYQGKDQKSAAQSMRISQQTFSRILKKARQAVSDAIVNGKIIHIQGGAIVQEMEPKSLREFVEIKQGARNQPQKSKPAKEYEHPQLIKENPYQFDFWKEAPGK